MTAAMFSLFAASANADVLVNQPRPSVACGKSFTLGVWYQSFSGGPNWATITVKAQGVTEFLLKTHATTQWHFWKFWGSCGRTYSVTYKVPGGTIRARVRVGVNGA